MRLSPLIQAPRNTRAWATLGLTIPEMMVTSTIFSLVALGFIHAHLFGLKYDASVQSKLGATEQSRLGFSKLSTDIRAAKTFRIGAGSQTAFTPVLDGHPQQGYALQLHPTTATNSFVRYYLDSTSKELRRLQTGITGYEVIADCLTNSVIFTSEDYKGTVLTEQANNQVVGINMQFYQFKYPLTPVGPGQFFDYYKLQFKVTRRAFD